jgi:hypothetical protein
MSEVGLLHTSNAPPPVAVETAPEPVAVAVTLTVPVAVREAGARLRVVGTPLTVVATGVTVEATPFPSIVTQGFMARSVATTKSLVSRLDCACTDIQVRTHQLDVKLA